MGEFRDGLQICHDEVWFDWGEVCWGLDGVRVTCYVPTCGVRTCSRAYVRSATCSCDVRTHVRILVKAFPQHSEKYEETVCCAGVTDDNRLIRLYPITYGGWPKRTSSTATTRSRHC